MKVLFHPLAERELIAAALYLDSEVGLGAKFLDTYEAWEVQVAKYPESCPEIGMCIRKGVLPRFKYLIGYKENSKNQRQSLNGYAVVRVASRSGGAAVQVGSSSS